MREGSVTGEDLAVQAAKEHLATIKDRDGFVEAMQVEPRGSRRAQGVAAGISIAMIVLTCWEWTAVASGPLRWLLFLVLLAVDAISLVAVIGSAPTAPPSAWPAAVIAETDHILLLREDGTQVEVAPSETLRAALRPGDIGVAHVRAEHPRARLVEFHRL